MKPDFVIVGAQKSGSSALMRYLAAHPQLFLPKAETRYFRDPWFMIESPSVLDAAVATKKPGVLRRGIKSPDLLALPEAPARLRDVLGNPKLIAVLRDPVARAISAYFWYMQWGWLPIAPVDEGLPKLLDGGYAADYPRSAEILEFGRYAAHLERYLTIFDRADLLVILTDDLKASPSDVAATAFAFLGVDPKVVITQQRRPVNEGVYSERRLRLLQHRHRHVVREFPGFEGTYVQRPAGVASWLVDRSIAGLDRLVLARVLDNAKPPVSDSVRAALADHYRADVARLAELLGRPLSEWSAELKA